MKDLDVKPKLEAALGFKLASIALLKEGSSPNYKAIRASDAMPFLVKLLPAATRAYAYPAIVAHLAELRGTKCCRRLFADVAENVGNDRLICLEWCEGTRKYPYQLSANELRDFLGDYQLLSSALQKCTHVAPCDGYAKWREKFMMLRGRWVKPLQKLVEREIPIATVTHQPELLKVIYGDFHHGNFVFKDGHVNRYFDLESISYGYPAEDIVRYYACAMEHLPLGGIFRRKALLRSFALAVSQLPYAKAEWLLAINGYIIRKLDGFEDGDITFFKMLNLFSRIRFYLKLRELCFRSITGNSN